MDKGPLVLSLEPLDEDSPSSLKAVGQDRSQAPHHTYCIFNKILRCFVCILKFEKHFVRETLTSLGMMT